MKELQRKQRIRRIVYSLPSLFILVVLAFLLARGAVRVVEQERESAARARVLAEKVAILTSREQELERSVASLQTEKGIKEEIKERFNVTEEGEHIAVIVDEQNIPTSTASSTISWYKWLWAVIMSDK